MKLLGLIILLLGTAPLTAQIGSVDVQEEKGIIDLLDHHTNYNNSQKFVTGWSVQILVSNDRFEAENTKIAFLRLYPDVKASVDFDEPYNRVRVGACMSKLEATTLKYEIMEHYPDAYVVVNHKLRPRDL